MFNMSLQTADTRLTDLQKHQRHGVTKCPQANLNGLTKSLETIRNINNHHKTLPNQDAQDSLLLTCFTFWDLITWTGGLAVGYRGQESKEVDDGDDEQHQPRSFSRPFAILHILHMFILNMRKCKKKLPNWLNRKFVKKILYITSKQTKHQLCLMDSDYLGLIKKKRKDQQTPHFSPPLALTRLGMIDLDVSTMEAANVRM